MNLVSSCMGDHSELIFAFWFSEDFNIQRYSEGFVFWLFWFVVPFWCLVSISLWLLDWWVDAWGLRADHRSVHLSTGNFRSTMQHLPQRKTPSAQRMFRWEGQRRISSNSICMQPMRESILRQPDLFYCPEESETKESSESTGSWPKQCQMNGNKEAISWLFIRPTNNFEVIFGFTYWNFRW